MKLTDILSRVLPGNIINNEKAEVRQSFCLFYTKIGRQYPNCLPNHFSDDSKDNKKVNRLFR